jgi:hypothetical protein
LFFDPLLVLGESAMFCAYWGVFSVITAYYGE